MGSIVEQHIVAIVEQRIVAMVCCVNL